MNLRAYVAAPFTEWATAASLRAYLRTHQIEVVSSWIDEAASLLGNEAAAADDTDWDAVAARNDADILDSHVVVSLVFPGGQEQWEECGFARGKRIPVIYVDHGGRLHLSTKRPCNRLVPDWGSLICELVGFDRDSRRAPTVRAAVAREMGE